MAEKKSLSAQIDDLRARLDEIDERLCLQAGAHMGAGRTAARQSYCALPKYPEREFSPDVSVDRARVIRVIEKKWVNGTVLHYYFFEDGLWGADNAEKDVVRQGFKMWKDVGIGIEFKEVNSPEDAEIRIGFLQDNRSWSYLGREILDQGVYERTMNFGWSLTDHPRELETAIHEIGHTLGFPHEHQNPFAGIVWDEEAVYDYFAGYPNYWDEETTYWNVLRKIYPDSVEGTQWDPDSIMHYSFGPGLIEEPAQYQNGLNPEPGLSDTDKSQVKLFYPPLDAAVYPELKRLESQLLSIRPGEQKNFNVLPTASGYYNFKTFGNSDTVMVLFEDVNGELRYVKGDDDSGTALNAQFRVRLTKNRKYVLRIRLYYNFSSGNTAVMMW